MTNSDHPSPKRVLVVGVYLVDKPNFAADINTQLLAASRWQVECRWACLGRATTPDDLVHVTHAVYAERVEKSVIINNLLKGVSLEEYEYVIVVDDDITLPPSFLDSYLEIVSKRNFVLSQPARSHSSYIDHYFVSQLFGIESRQTNFVEIGPLFCVHKHGFPLIFPLDEAAPMGWGLDFVWPKLMEDHNLKMGIVDQLCVDHSLRKPVSFYDHGETDARMKTFFQSRPHLTYEQSFRIIETFAQSK